MNLYPGPWEITKKSAGNSYELKHRDTGKPGKRHAAHLSPFPRELLPCLTADGADNRFGQLHVPIQSDPYKNAGIKGFTPTQPFNFTHICIAHSAATDIIHFPSLAELNIKLFDWHHGKEEALAADESLYIELDVSATHLTIQPPPNPAPVLASPRVPTSAI